MLIDFHTHHPRRAAGTLEIVNRYYDQPAADLPACSVGLHPWFVQSESITDASLWLHRQAGEKNVLAIGECGLDRVCKTAWDLQTSAFETCIEVSENFHKPLIIHCVRAFDALLATHKRRQPRQPWIVHGYDKNFDTAQSLLRFGIYLSFGAALFHEKSHAAAVLSRMPADRFFLETDDQTLVDIAAVYARAAEIRQIPVDVLQVEIAGLMSRLFPITG